MWIKPTPLLPLSSPFSEQGQLEEVDSGYTLFWSGRSMAVRHDAGVAFAVWNDIVGRLPCLPQGIHDRLMSFLPVFSGRQQTVFYRSRRLVQQRLREMQDTRMPNKTEDIPGYVDRNEWKNFFATTKAVYEPLFKGSSPLLSSDGTTLLTDKSQILKRWAEHFRRVLKQLSTISDATIERLSEVGNNADLNLLNSLQKTIRAVQ
ncbi:unnamed protein product [Schistocephalus solidus]|uniref:Uncharacterized protein n=1 Tax=Schistocephalus solidus TaxID=70667 RepID=A0A183SQ65_SCHSO|nr:unnamed protein product [Schistocephalus solidus]